MLKAASLKFTDPSIDIFQTTVLDACAQIRSRLTEIKSLGNAKQYGLFLTDEDPKKGVWLDPTKTLEHYLLRNNVRRFSINILKIFFPGNFF